MMVGMETRAEKDAKTLAIVRALAIFVLVLATASFGVYLMSKAGVHITEGAFPVVIAIAALLSVVFLVRNRDG